MTLTPHGLVAQTAVAAPVLHAAMPASTLPAAQAALVFADGVEGAAATVGFNLSNGLRVLQQHIARLDGEVLTSFVATVPEGRRAQLDELVAMARSYSPT